LPRLDLWIHTPVDHAPLAHINTPESDLDRFAIRQLRVPGEIT